MDDTTPDFEADIGLADRQTLAAVLRQAGTPATMRQQTDQAAPIQWTIPGFEGECRITTNFGDLPIKALRRRDMVKTISGAFREVKKVDAFRLDEDFLARHPAAQPVMIRAKALGGTHPQRPILVSPAQAAWLPRVGEGFRAKTALALEGTPNVHRAHRSEITYYRFHLGEEDKVAIEGSWFVATPY